MIFTSIPISKGCRNKTNKDMDNQKTGSGEYSVLNKCAKFQGLNMETPEAI